MRFCQRKEQFQVRSRAPGTSTL